MGHAERLSAANAVANHLEAQRQPIQLVDHWQRPILVGGLYEFHPEYGTVLVKVDKIEPVRDLRKPAGLLAVTFSLTRTIEVPNGAMIKAMTLIAALDPAQGQQQQGQQGQEPPPPGDEPPAEPANLPANLPAEDPPTEELSPVDPSGPGAIQLTDL